MNKIFKLFFWVCLLFFVSACSQRNSANDKHSASRFDIYKGKLQISCDAGLEPIFELQKEIFDYNYDSVQLDVNYENEKDMLANFGSKKSTLLVMTRMLTKTEINNFIKQDTLYVKQLPVAYDAVALIATKDFDDTNLDVAKLKEYFNPENTSTKVPKLVFENQNSSTVSFVLDTLGYNKKVSKNVYALQSYNQVIEYVLNNENVIGFVPYNVLSDSDDPRVKKLFEKIKILSLSSQTKEGQISRVSANQSDIATGDYPFIRIINLVAAYTFKNNLEALLINFLYKGKGTKIFLKAGLVPTNMAEREINVNDKAVIL